MMIIVHSVTLDFFSIFIGILIGVTSFIFIFGYHCKRPSSIVERSSSLHWNPSIERRGLGNLITRLNHIAITVYDVGRSVSFYVDVLGFQQIRRPSFDRHGAWLTMGNVELHLIKGIPAIPSVSFLFLLFHLVIIGFHQHYKELNIADFFQCNSIFSPFPQIETLILQCSIPKIETLKSVVNIFISETFKNSTN
ncbi:unnamed protein product [Adineta ricciae]|uniref:Glyoxalase/fosfomycin resistance/dioxygenase domain-containing protein n=1 Tax=Adineta ricciae TaxID=249248 RepID=A0A815QDJ4_ADIRI|nr:unnamed protein product [Adineta ricciae]